MADVQTQSALIEAHALARHVRMSPQKARLVMDLIRGQKAQGRFADAEVHAEGARLSTSKRCCAARSPMRNARRRDSGAPLDVDMLFVRSVL